MGAFTSKPAPISIAKQHVLSASEKAKLDIKIQRDRLCKAEARMGFEGKALEQHARAACRKGDRDAAANFLKLMKIKQKRQSDLNGTILNLETVLGQIDVMQEMAGVAKALEGGTRILQALAADMPVERAEQIMEDAGDAIATTAEIGAVFARELDIPDRNGESMLDVVNRELDELFATRDAEAKGTPVSAPSTEPVPDVVLPDPASFPVIPQGMPTRQRSGSLTAAPTRVAMAS